MSQLMDLTTKFASGQYEGKQLREVITADIAYIQVEVRRGVLRMTPGAERTYKAIASQGVKQNVIEVKKVVETTEDENKFTALKERRTVVLNKFNVEITEDLFLISEEEFTKLCTTWKGLELKAKREEVLKPFGVELTKKLLDLSGVKFDEYVATLKVPETKVEGTETKAEPKVDEPKVYGVDEEQVGDGIVGAVLSAEGEKPKDEFTFDDEQKQ